MLLLLLQLKRWAAKQLSAATLSTIFACWTPVASSDVIQPVLFYLYFCR